MFAFPLANAGKDSKTLKYTEKFKQHCNLYKKNCSKLKKTKIAIGKIPWWITFGNDTIGVCDTNNNEILLSKEYWKRATVSQREQLVFHELAHCVLDKDHITSDMSIMNPNIQSEYTYILYYQYLQNELFDCSKNCPMVNFDQEFYDN